MLEMMLLGTGSGLLARLLPQIGGVFAKTAKALWQAKLEKQRHTREKEILQIEIDGKLHIADLNSKRDIAVSEHQLQQAEAQIASNNYAVSQERYQKTNDALLKLAVITRESEKRTGFYGARIVFYIRAAIVPFIAPLVALLRLVSASIWL